MNKEYEVEYVSAGSQHPLSKYVENEEELFVIEVNDQEELTWWKASDFFYVKGEMNFKEV